MAERTAVTIGFFDGVHLGHRALLQRVRQEADARGLEAVAVTFDLHSLEVLHGQGMRPTLLTTLEKVEQLQTAGMQRVEVLHFTPEFAAQTGEQFIADYLVGQLRAAYVAVGHDFRFGRGRAYTADDLKQVAGEFGVEVDVLSRVEIGGARVSSSALRELVVEGRVAAVPPLLGRPFSLRGLVVEGRRMGRSIGFPTANLAVDRRKLLPAHGVYVVQAGEPTEARLGMMNIGLRPTVGGGGVTIEVHLLDYDADLYGATLEVQFLDRLRDERRFDSLEALRQQLERDREAARLVGAAGLTAA